MCDEKQLDLFGNEVDISSISNKPRYVKKNSRELFNVFRQMYGFDENHKCGDCKFCINKNIYYKCEKMGVNNLEETNIAKENKACKLFIEKEQ